MRKKLSSVLGSIALSLLGLNLYLSFYYNAAWALVQPNRPKTQPATPHTRHPKELSWNTLATRSELPVRSNTLELIKYQTPVKNQGERGTCSIFSSIALVESLLISELGYPKNSTNLSEEWLNFLAMRERGDDGSTSDLNLYLLSQFGSSHESTLPYVEEDWALQPHHDLATERCGHLRGKNKKTCLWAHRDPTLMELGDEELLDRDSEWYDPAFARARSEAKEFQYSHLKRSSTLERFLIPEIYQIKEELLENHPVILELDFYLGAWNHGEGPDYGIPIDPEQWARGIVGYPAPDSVDRVESKKRLSGHSVLVVGYDDNVTISTHQLMKDGSTQHLRLKGVYYFKAAWGTDSFGSEFYVQGKKVPGYGMISQKYAHEMGEFFRLPLQYLKR